MKQLILLATMALSWASYATTLIPAAPQSQAILIQGGTLHTVTQGTLPDTDLLMVDGRIAKIGSALTPPEGAIVVDASGKRVYPGLISMASTLGLQEIGMVRSTVDQYEVGSTNPQIDAVQAYNPDSELIPTVRSNGITHAQITPHGEMLAGQSSVLNLDAWTIEDAMVKPLDGLHLYWPELKLHPTNEKRQQQQKEAQQQALDELHQAFADAYGYYQNQQRREKQDRRWLAMKSLFEGKINLYVHADRQQQIEQALQLAQKYRLKLVIIGGYDSYRLTEQLVAQQVPVVYTHANGLPLRRHEAFDLPFTIPSLLQDAGVSLALAYPGSWDSRNLPFAAGYAAANGLDANEALKAITYQPAQIMGLTDMGALEQGFRANVIVSDGDLLDMGQAKIDAIYIDGRQIDLDNRHNQLYQKYQQKGQ